MNNTISPAARELLALTSKLALLGTIDDEGKPHLTFLSSLEGLGEDRVMFGQFCVGLSKEFLPKRPDCAFLALTADMKWLRGRARFTHTAKTGPEFDMYNNKPLFRYNAYFGVNTVWYLDLLEITEVEKLPVLQIGLGALLSRAAAPFAAKSEKNALNLFGRALFAGIDSPKFLCCTGENGLSITPIVQATHAGTDRIAFAGSPFGEDLAGLAPGTPVSVMALNLDMQSVLVKGSYFGKKAGAHVIDIERIYNSMPPASGYIYPKAAKPEAITEF
ncbi:MAG: hypothetical protein FWE98_04725 [Oscillospiraceae bacterium]|nr:hypothetical protein [Oscillospiraceae bacterium]